MHGLGQGVTGLRMGCGHILGSLYSQAYAVLEA
jgi:hypothetical protein